MIQAVPLPRSASSDPQFDAIKTPPHSEDAEQSLLGGLLHDNRAWDKIADVVTAADFYRGDHRLIFSHICKLIERSHPADVITVAESLESNKELQGVGGIEYLGSLQKNSSGAANIRRYAEIVRERAVMRKLAEAGIDITESAYNAMGRSADELLDAAEARVFAIAEAGARAGQGFVEIPPLLTQVVERIDMLYARDNPSDIT
ncbi:MAG: replicative DNA helicase, partial [Burkholderiales bacterium]|nr:replicative DNA helicase [Burkholderiales bacterium]